MRGLFAAITFETDHLALQVDERDKLPLTAESGTKFLFVEGPVQLETDLSKRECFA